MNIDDGEQGAGNVSANSKNDGGLILSKVRAIAISPQKAMEVADQYRGAARKSNPSASDIELKKIVAKKVIKKYAQFTALSGGTCALPGVIPGVGTAAAIGFGGLGDTVVCLKAQVDMTMVLAANAGWDLTEQDAQHMVLLIAVCGGLEKLGVGTGVPLASKAGVKMLRMYLKGGALVASKEFFKRFGVVFTRKSLEKALPFGIGVAFGSSVNYALTTYVGTKALQFFSIDAEIEDNGIGDEVVA